MTDGGAARERLADAGELTPKGRATRGRIVAAAADLMFEQGVAGTSLQDVQQAARVSGSQLYATNDRVTTAELCEAAGLAATTYRRARAALLAGDDVTIEDAGGGRGRCNVWQLPDADSQATPQLAPGRRASPHGQDRPPLARDVARSPGASASGLGASTNGTSAASRSRV